MITYRIELDDLHAHLYRVTLTIPAPAAAQRFSLPVWIPGSYLVREFARHLSGLEARQGRRRVVLTQIDKASWQADCAGQSPLVVTCRVYAFDTSVRAAFLDAHRGFFNGTSLCLRVDGRDAEPHRLELGTLPRGWQVATSLRPAGDAGSSTAHRLFEAADYDELVDHPVEIGPFWRGTFEAHGVPHELVVAGALPNVDTDRLLADTQRICETEIAFWHGADATARDVPFDRYVFLLNCVDDGYGGLEHRASTALIASRRDLPMRRVNALAAADPPSDGYATLLGLISHEYFHTWNVKRLMPREFAPYDYTRENYTELLWFFEGFTSYYDDLLLRRAGLIDDARYLGSLGKTITQVLNAPGRHVQSVAQASFDAWVKYYRSDENTPNATISYYTKGSLVALSLDLALRVQGSGASARRRHLDEVMRRLWERTWQRAASASPGALTEADIEAVLREVAGQRAADAIGQRLSDAVHGTADLPLRELLAPFGVSWRVQPATLAQRLGLKASEGAFTGVKVTHVLRGGAAERAGVAAGDELLAVDGWRLRRLDDALRVIDGQRASTLLISRDQRLHSLPLRLPPANEVPGSVTLSIDPTSSRGAIALRRAWLDG
jgi:predicted metalloprotease with PDZ domain